MTITLKVQVEVRPALSLAVQTTAVVPAGKQVPLTKLQVTVGLGSHSSVARGVVKVTLAHVSSHS